MPTKTEMVRKYLANDDIRKALCVAKGFRIGLTKEERSILVRGYECLTHRQFYLQLGMNPDEEVNKALDILERWR